MDKRFLSQTSKIIDGILNRNGNENLDGNVNGHMNWDVYTKHMCIIWEYTWKHSCVYKKESR